MFVFDATPLLSLAKAGRLDPVGELGSRCVLPEQVHEEIVTAGLEAGHADARRVDRAVADGRLDVVQVEETDAFERLRSNQNLTDADAAVLAAADARDATAVMDEQYGRDVADAEGIPTRGTAFLVLVLLRDEQIPAEAARTTIDAMVDSGWYCATDLYARIRRRIDELEKQ